MCRVVLIGFGFTLLSLISDLSAQPPASVKNSQRADIPWLTEELFKEIQPRLNVPSSYQFPANKTDLDKAGARLTPEQRKALEEQKEIQQAAETIARSMTFGVVPDTDDNPLAADYRKAAGRFRDASIELVLARNRQILAYKTSEEQNQKLEDGWHLAIKNCHKTKADWILKGATLYASEPTKYFNIGRSLVEAMLYDFPLDRVDGWIDPLILIVKAGGPLVSDELVIEGIGACIANHRYAEVSELAAILRERGLLDSSKEEFLAKLPAQEMKWAQELERRKQDSEKGNNPLVEIRTSKGIMIVELYEDDAPEAVNLFVYLIERGYYDLKTFFRVEKHMVVQTGCEKGDGSGSAGFTIRGEAKLPNRRSHFRGSLAIALGSDGKGNVDQDSGSSQFYICQSDLPHLDSDYTVFGHIVEGIETLGLFRQMNLANKEEREAKKTPDLIIRAKVIRKRDHVYKPTPTTGKLFR